MMLLSQARQGSSAEITRISSGRALGQRLAELGLFEGERVCVLKNDHGPLVLLVLGGKIAVGRGQAEKIEVKP